MSIAPIASSTPLADLGQATRPAASAAPGFAETLNTALERVNTLAVQGDHALVALAKGEEADLHGAMIALQEADIAVRAMVTVRDKLVAAYDQIMNMGI